MWPPQRTAPQCCVSTDAASWPGGHYAASSPPCDAGTQLPGEGQARPNSSSPPALRACFPTPAPEAAQAPSMVLLTGGGLWVLPCCCGCRAWWGGQAAGRRLSCSLLSNQQRNQLLVLQGQMWASVTHQPGVFLPLVTGNQGSSKREALPEGPPPPVSSAELQLWEEAEPQGEGCCPEGSLGRRAAPALCPHQQTSHRASVLQFCRTGSVPKAVLEQFPSECRTNFGAHGANYWGLGLSTLHSC